jgi:cytochrome c oxidase subunit 2
MSQRRSRSPLVPVIVILTTAALTSLFLIKSFGMPNAQAQPSPAPRVGLEPAPAGSGAGSAANTAGTDQGSNQAAAPAAGSATTPAGTGSGAAPAGSGVAVPTADGSAAPAPANGSAAPAAGGAPATGAPAAGAPGAGAGSGAKPAAEEMPWYDKLANQPIDEAGNFWFPKAVNKIADESDMMFYVVLGLSAFFFFGIAGLVIYFTIKYRHRPGHRAEPSATHHDAMEITWTIIPTIIVVFLFYYGWRGYIHVVTPPQKAVEVQVQAWRWAWNFTHYNGVEDSDLHVPVDTPVRLVMTSRDVLHAFYAPVMRVKQDIIPRRYTYAWFQATKPGTYRLTCAEYCGKDHSQMGIKPDGRRTVIVVHEPGGYEKYLQDKAAASGGPPEKIGKTVYETKGCSGCHTIDGSARVGPSFKGSWGKTINLVEGPTKFDENYVRESLATPTAKGRPGYNRTMPSFEGQLSEKQIEGVIAFLKSLGDGQ